MAGNKEIESSMSRLQRAMGYQFEQESILTLALTAAGAEETNHDGNRRLAQLGEALIESVLVDKAYSEGSSRSVTSAFRQKSSSKKYRAAVAKVLEIDSCIKHSPRQNDQPPSTTVLSLALSAIVGAVWIDSGKDFGSLEKIIDAMGIPFHGESDAEVEALLNQQYPLSNELDGPLVATVDSIAGEREFLAQNDIAEERSGDESGLGDHATLTIDNHSLGSVDGLENWLIEGRNSHNFDPLTIATNSITGWPLNNNTTCSGGNREEISGHDSVTLGRGSEVSSSPRSTQLDETLFTTVMKSTDSQSEFQIQNSPRQCPLEGVGLLAQSLPETSAEYIVARHPAKKRKEPDVRTNLPWGKRRRNDWSSLLDKHISRERGKYQGLGIACPQHLFPTALLELPVSFGHTDYRAELVTFFFAIGSSESLAVFQDMILMHRRSVSRVSRDAERRLSNGERIRTIERLDGCISYFQFIKRCHTHALFISSGVPDQRASDNFVVETCQSATSRKTTRRGNPMHFANAQLTTSMMKETYPDLEEKDADYQRKYRFITTLRVLGQRLNLLVDRFGLGILGLIPLASGTLDVDTIQNVDDRMILSLPEDIFKRIVQFLDEHQGDLLRQLSKEITKVVISMFHGTLNHAGGLFIETIDRSEILKQPGPSQELCSLISEGPRA